ncbi:uncharacterized protein PHACADRAFT_134939 [Phanerochaete carnosa HHB-10118-sp]|uniref:Lipase-like C-terminal domain-containing protein n=1 Tax=Phanerochaete carnosa (strain HHB-10118-sp) TaxID=650164 RepID=K5WBR3_PHACS|nr:uncharacterized protein PHACADRAFT_134939 [Phanerochaete carnosa HHB-10118-sp]EKM61368.1 hypothetical protein PHACADRAFT_134939 [Phanerochaete carnosa HHB-10118-sp]
MCDKNIGGGPGVSPTRTQGPTPLVIVEGFLGGAGPLLWGNFGSHCDSDCQSDAGKPRRKVIFVSIGPVSSLHDRACELYYALKGGTVDYGAAHARANGHARYGRHHHVGLYPEWSFEKPLHFIGHSVASIFSPVTSHMLLIIRFHQGGPTITKLQWLLDIGFFGRSETPNMVLSLTAISSPFRGTQVVYTLGERTDQAPRVRPFSIGSLLTKGVHIASYLSPYMPTFLDMHADARSMSYMTTSFRKFVMSLRQSDWGESRDAAPFDVTFEAADLREANFEGLPHPQTYYRSYAAQMVRTAKTNADTAIHGHHKPSIRYALLNLPLFALSSIMGSYNFSAIKPSPSVVACHNSYNDFYRSRWHDCGDQAIRANDGIVPIFSQWHPFNCS